MVCLLLLLKSLFVHSCHHSLSPFTKGEETFIPTYVLCGDLRFCCSCSISCLFSMLLILTRLFLIHIPAAPFQGKSSFVFTGGTHICHDISLNTWHTILLRHSLYLPDVLKRNLHGLWGCWSIERCWNPRWKRIDLWIVCLQLCIVGSFSRSMCRGSIDSPIDMLPFSPIIATSVTMQVVWW